MAGMWELPLLGRVDDPTNSAHKKSNYEPWRTFRHSITTTDYKVHVVRQNGTGRSGSRSKACGKWIATADLPHMPLTGLTRKVLRAASII